MEASPHVSSSWISNNTTILPSAFLSTFALSGTRLSVCASIRFLNIAIESEFNGLPSFAQLSLTPVATTPRLRAYISLFSAPEYLYILKKQTSSQSPSCHPHPNPQVSRKWPTPTSNPSAATANTNTAANSTFYRSAANPAAAHSALTIAPKQHTNARILANGRDGSEHLTRHRTERSVLGVR